MVKDSVENAKVAKKLNYIINKVMNGNNQCQNAPKWSAKAIEGTKKLPGRKSPPRQHSYLD